MEEGKIIYKDLSYKINGWLFKTHQELGKFRKEKDYGDYLEHLLKNDALRYAREYRIKDFKEVHNIVDFIVDDKIIIELKAKSFLTKDDFNQVKCYLSALNLKLGLLVNFRHDKAIIRRVLN